MWIYGFHPVREALRNPSGRIEQVLLGRERADARSAEIRRLCGEAGVPCLEVEEAELSRQIGDSAGDASHNGVAAQLSGEAVGRAAPNSQLPNSQLVVLVEDVQDPGNLGALIRVCDAAGVDRLLVRDRGSTQLTAAVVKTSAGAAEWLPLERITNTAQEIERLKKDGYWVYGAAEGGVPPWEADLSGKVVLCIGGEEKGLRHLTRQSCDVLVGLPMAGRVESLNLATAAAAILFEIVRQRSIGSGSGPAE